jgi:acetyl esterase/lipase
MRLIGLICHALITLVAPLAAQVSPAPPPDSATFDPDHTAHITRVVPMPSTISPEAQQWLGSLDGVKSLPKTVADFRAMMDPWRKQSLGEALKYYPVNVEEACIAGVRIDIITPLVTPEANRNRVLINLHGGGFWTDASALTEGIPIANLTKTKVVAVYYRLAPENPFPCAVDDVIAVYQELLKIYRPASIGIYGSSAGAILTCEVAVKLKQLGMPLPAALGVFSGKMDFSRVSDSAQLFSVVGFPGEMQPQDPTRPPEDSWGYIGKTDRKDPALSPLFADLHGMPPSLLVSSTRDLALSDTAIFHRALLRAGCDAQLVVFEAMPHAFWCFLQLPETKEALELMAKFFDEKVER